MLTRILRMSYGRASLMMLRVWLGTKRLPTRIQIFLLNDKRWEHLLERLSVDTSKSNDAEPRPAIVVVKSFRLACETSVDLRVDWENCSSRGRRPFVFGWKNLVRNKQNP